MSEGKVIEAIEIPDPPGKRTKVAIVGFAPSWKQAPFSDTSWDIYCLNEMYKLAGEVPTFRATLWFELHSTDSKSKNTPEHMAFLRSCPVPVMMQRRYDDIPNSVRFPKEEIVEWLRSKGYKGAGYFTNSISWMFVYAMMQGYTTIALYGVDMANDCIAPDMRVLTADLRWVRAGDLREGQELLAFDEHAGTKMNMGCSMRHWRRSVVEHVQHIKRPCYRINLEDGRTIVASQGHQWLVDTEHTHQWKRTDELVTNMHREGRPSRIVKLFDKPWDEDNTRDGGYLAAAFDGEGHITQHGRKHNNGSAVSVGFAQKNNPMLHKVLSLMEGRFQLSVQQPEENGTWKLSIAGGRSEILRFLGEIRPQRLLAKFDPDNLGVMQRKDTVAVESIGFIGEQDVIGLRTSTQTIIVEGLASHNSEYGWQRPSCEYFIGVAEGMGIEVIVPPASDLLKCTQLYGFESDNRNRVWIKTQMGELDKRGDALSQQLVLARETVRRLEIQQAEVRGARSAYYEVLKRTQ